MLNRTPGRWGDILRNAGDKDAFMQGIKDQYPRDYILYYDRLEAFANREYARVDPYVPEFTNFLMPVDLQNWFNDFMVGR